MQYYIKDDQVVVVVYKQLSFEAYKLLKSLGYLIKFVS